MATIDLTKPDESLWKAFNFPDGQPHISTSCGDLLLARIASSDDLLRVLLAADAMRQGGTSKIHLIISYLMGARMDRRMPKDGDLRQPFTLKVIADVLKTGDFDTITIFDPHSDVAPALLNANSILPVSQVGQALAFMAPDTVLVAPDAGASKRVSAIAEELGGWPVVQAVKHRDMATGELWGFEVINGEFIQGRPVLIVDDILDGGRTFSGIGEELRRYGPTCVNLYVSHGIFSHGFHIDHVDTIYTTNSYRKFDGLTPNHIIDFPWNS